MQSSSGDGKVVNIARVYANHRSSTDVAISGSCDTTENEAAVAAVESLLQQCRLSRAEATPNRMHEARSQLLWQPDCIEPRAIETCIHDEITSRINKRRQREGKDDPCTRGATTP